MNFLGPETKADCAKFFRIRVGAVGLVLAEFFPRQLISIFGAANESSYYTDFALQAFRVLYEEKAKWLRKNYPR